MCPKQFTDDRDCGRGRDLGLDTQLDINQHVLRLEQEKRKDDICQRDGNENDDNSVEYRHLTERRDEEERKQQFLSVLTSLFLTISYIIRQQKHSSQQPHSDIVTGADD